MAMFFSLPVTAAMDLRLSSEAGPTSTQRSGNLNRGHVSTNKNVYIEDFTNYAELVKCLL